VVGIFKETGSGVRLDRAERRKVMALAQARRIDAVLVTELSRWGRSTTDLLATLKELEARRLPGSRPWQRPYCAARLTNSILEPIWNHAYEPLHQERA
jgi:hypothetical protein